MKKNAFTLVELLTVLAIVAILAAAVIPIMHARVDAAKWSEGKAVAGTIAQAIRLYCLDRGMVGPYGEDIPDINALGLSPSDLKGRYFNINYFNWYTDISVNMTPIYRITIKKPPSIASPDRIILNEDGVWSEEND
ncbi:MAG: prepilin-type N-terminal cleavage/methylation domain-containing protein [Sedimentisphaerales bacterium]|nr:prepilin-type N-terminal cleavage/methylation domain-containing protein [Sedimentisphaerales bacterium]